MKAVTLFFSIISSLFCYSQVSTNSCGSSATGAGGSASYTIGQIFYTNLSSSSGSVSQGVQQAFSISTETSIESTESIKLNIYPNPTTDKLVLNINEYSNNSRVELYDLNGKLLFNDNISSNEFFIDMNRYETSTYYLKVIDDSKELKTFKVIKNK